MAASPEFPPAPVEVRRERRIPRWALIAVIVLLGLIALGAIAPTLSRIKLRLVPEEMEEVMRAPPPGFYPGYVAGNVWVFMFYEHPQYGLRPLRDGELLPCDELVFYFLTLTDVNATIRAEEYVLKTQTVGNRTVQVRLDNRTYRAFAYCPARQATRFVLRLAETDTMKYVDIYVNGFHVARLRHKTWPAFRGVGYYTLGSLERDRAGFVVLTAIVCAIAFALAKLAIGKIKYVPDLPRWAVGLMFVAGLAAGAAAWWLIQYYALIRAAYLTLPIGLITFIYGLYLMRMRPHEFYLSKLYAGLGTTPRKDIVLFHVVGKIHEDRWELAPVSWREALLRLLRRPKLLILRTADDASPLWHFDLGMGDREYIFEDLAEDEDGHLVAIVAPLHRLDVEKWTYGLLTAEDLARDKEHYRKALMDLRRRMEQEVDARVYDELRRFYDLRRQAFLGRRGPQPPVPTTAHVEVPEAAETRPPEAGGGGEGE